MQTANPFISSYQQFLTDHKVSSENDVSKILSKMVTVSDENCFVFCKLTSLASQRELALCKINLEINPDFTLFIEEIEKVDVLDEKIFLEPGESFDCLFRIKIKKLDAEMLRNINSIFGNLDD